MESLTKLVLDQLEGSAARHHLDIYIYIYIHTNSIKVFLYPTSKIETTLSLAVQQG